MKRQRSLSSSSKCTTERRTCTADNLQQRIPNTTRGFFRPQRPFASYTIPCAESAVYHKNTPQRTKRPCMLISSRQCLECCLSLRGVHTQRPGTRGVHRDNSSGVCTPTAIIVKSTWGKTSTVSWEARTASVGGRFWEDSLLPTSSPSLL